MLGYAKSDLGETEWTRLKKLSNEIIISSKNSPERERAYRM